RSRPSGRPALVFSTGTRHAGSTAVGDGSRSETITVGGAAFAGLGGVRFNHHCTPPKTTRASAVMPSNFSSRVICLSRPGGHLDFMPALAEHRGCAQKCTCKEPACVGRHRHPKHEA